MALSDEGCLRGPAPSPAAQLPAQVTSSSNQAGETSNTYSGAPAARTDSSAGSPLSMNLASGVSCPRGRARSASTCRGSAPKAPASAELEGEADLEARAEEARRPSFQSSRASSIRARVSPITPRIRRRRAVAAPTAFRTSEPDPGHKPADIPGYPRASWRPAPCASLRDLQGFHLTEGPTAASLKIVVSPVRFRPSPFWEAAARRELFRPDFVRRKHGLRRRLCAPRPLHVQLGRFPLDRWRTQSCGRRETRLANHISLRTLDRAIWQRSKKTIQTHDVRCDSRRQIPPSRVVEADRGISPSGAVFATRRLIERPGGARTPGPASGSAPSAAPRRTAGRRSRAA
jgi:hypothetical protein